jgi:hypothetical protein
VNAFNKKNLNFFHDAIMANPIILVDNITQ